MKTETIEIIKTTITAKEIITTTVDSCCLVIVRVYNHALKELNINLGRFFMRPYIHFFIFFHI